VTEVRRVEIGLAVGTRGERQSLVDGTLRGVIHHDERVSAVHVRVPRGKGAVLRHEQEVGRSRDPILRDRETVSPIEHGSRHAAAGSVRPRDRHKQR
jgi:hypothetical protein